MTLSADAKTPDIKELAVLASEGKLPSPNVSATSSTPAIERSSTFGLQSSNTEGYDAVDHFTPHHTSFYMDRISGRHLLKTSVSFALKLTTVV